MDLSLFDFDLPESLIALRPISPRDAARLLVARPDSQSDHQFTDLTNFLTEKDTLVFNNTRVLPTRLSGRIGAARVEATLLKAVGEGTWTALARPGKKFKPGAEVDFEGVLARVLNKGEGGETTLEFNIKNMKELFDKSGKMPLPPYIAKARDVDHHDRADYQTTYAEIDGAVAAPTAGLHFTESMMQSLNDKGVSRAFLTLHVGAGTFLPVKVENTDDHKMHAEWGEITKEAADSINKTRQDGGKVVAVGTTSLRLLESAADETGQIHQFRGETDIFITPGYKFRAVDMLLTNFHLPKSTLFMLVSAFSGLEVMKAAYQHAIESGYRFYSYGDACLLYPKAT